MSLTQNLILRINFDRIFHFNPKLTDSIKNSSPTTSLRNILNVAIEFETIINHYAEKPLRDIYSTYLYTIR